VDKKYGQFQVWQVEERNWDSITETEGYPSTPYYDEKYDEWYYYIDFTNIALKKDSWNNPNSSWAKVGFEFCFGKDHCASPAEVHAWRKGKQVHWNYEKPVFDLKNLEEPYS
jgi:hypothetical protein